jgi:hypothetical protein
MHRLVRPLLCPLVRAAGVLSLGLLAAWPAGAADGLNPPADAWQGPRWAARLTVSQQQRVPQWRLMGDYYLLGPARIFGPDASGGLRLTSGLFSGPRGAMFGQSRHRTLADNGDINTTWPYLGLGYSAASLRGGWGFSADLGLAAEQPGMLRLGRMFSRDLDDQLRELRLRPLLQVGVSYAF